MATLNYANILIVLPFFPSGGARGNKRGGPGGGGRPGRGGKLGRGGNRGGSTRGGSTRGARGILALSRGGGRGAGRGRGRGGARGARGTARGTITTGGLRSAAAFQKAKQQRFNQTGVSPLNRKLAAAKVSYVQNCLIAHFTTIGVCIQGSKLAGVRESAAPRF